jgi:uncharacterized membrane protein YdjX (TVP38/TMEM64 family)
MTETRKQAPDAHLPADAASESSTEITLGRVLRSTLIFAIVFATILGTLHWLGVTDMVSEYKELANRAPQADQERGDALRVEFFGTWGSLSVLIFLGLLAIRPLILVPGSWLAPVAAFLFGPLYGTLYKVVGETIAACVAFGFAKFGLARRIGVRSRPQSQHLLARLDRALERRSFLTVLGLRLNLGIPYDALNFGLGFTRVRFMSYVAGTFIGIVPGTLAYVFLANSAMEGDMLKAALWILGILLMILLTIPLARQLLKESEEPDTQRQPPAR